MSEISTIVFVSYIFVSFIIGVKAADYNFEGKKFTKIQKTLIIALYLAISISFSAILSLNEQTLWIEIPMILLASQVIIPFFSYITGFVHRTSTLENNTEEESD